MLLTKIVKLFTDCVYLIFVLLERHHIGDAAAGEEAQREGHRRQPGHGSCGAPAPKAAGAAGGGSVATAVSQLMVLLHAV